MPMPADLDPYTLIPENQVRHYGELKAFAEKEVAKHYPGIATIIRPGLIVGPLDQSERFTYWPVRIERGGNVLAPGAPDDPVQIIDARDIAEWTVRMAETRSFGVYNAMGPAKPMTMAEMLHGIKAITTAGAQFTFVPEEFLGRYKIGAWIDMPVWVPPHGASLGFTRRNNARAVEKGLTFRPLAVTAADTLAWQKTRPVEEQARLADDATSNPGPRRTGISRAREAEVLAAWAAYQKNRKS
jgi:2'-hydroxyisoflavone reductase